MKDEVELPTSVHVEDAEKVFVKKVRRLSNTGYVSINRKFVGKDVIVIVPKNIESIRSVLMMWSSYEKI